MIEAAYLQPNRLEDVIFLIQYLGLGTAYSVELDTEPLGVVPRSANSRKWCDVARDHPEFFRVIPEKETTVLSLRYYLRTPDGSTPPLPAETVQTLVKNAMELHERQAKRVEVWRGRVTMLTAVVAAVSGIAGLFVGK